MHPGYGFLSENAKFADILDAHNIALSAPRPITSVCMGDKIAAKAKAIELGIPVVPGSDGEVKTSDAALELARDMGFPVLVKAASGGGGRGMKIARSEDELAEAFTTARSEAKAAFGDDAVYIEKYLEKPAILKFRSLATRTAMPCIWASATAPCNAATRRFSKKPPQRCWTPAARAAIGKIVTDAMEGMQYLGRHGRVFMKAANFISSK